MTSYDNFSILLWVYERTGSMDSQMCTHCSALWQLMVSVLVGWSVQVTLLECLECKLQLLSTQLQLVKASPGVGRIGLGVESLRSPWYDIPLYTSLKQETIEIWDHFLHDLPEEIYIIKYIILSILYSMCYDHPQIIAPWHFGVFK